MKHINQEILDECCEQAIRIGRKWMNNKKLRPHEISDAEWSLALILFKRRLENE